MWRQTYRAAAAGALLHAACRPPAPAAAPAASPPAASAPDLILADAAFARLVDGRVAAAGTARELRYRHAGGRFEALDGRARLSPAPSGSLASFGELRVAARAVEGDVRGRDAVGTGGVEMAAARGDVATTESAALDASGAVTSSAPVEASGPGYRIHGARLVARADGSEIRFSGGAGGLLLPDLPAAPSPSRPSRRGPRKARPTERGGR